MQSFVNVEAGLKSQLWILVVKKEKNPNKLGEKLKADKYSVGKIIA